MALFATAQPLADDPILGLMELFHQDQRSQKVNLCIGIYYDEQGQIPRLSAVQKAEERLTDEPRFRGYLPIDGLPEYRASTQALVFGRTSSALAQERVVTAQTVGSSAAITVAASLIKAQAPHTVVALSAPTWDNHRAIFHGAGLSTQSYTYYDARTHGVDLPRMLADLAQLPRGSVVVLHACCHNPTGADLRPDQWQQVITLVKARELIPLFDLAYQGFHHGIDEDAMAIRMAVTDELALFFVVNSYSKSFALYGERVGALSIVTPSRSQAKIVLTHLKQVIRANYSSPPTYGARIVATILQDPRLNTLWVEELAHMRQRIQQLRAELVQRLVALNTPQLSFIEQHNGLFTYTGLNPQQVARLQRDHGIYMVRSGRLCVAGLSRSNLDYVAKAIADVLR